MTQIDVERHSLKEKERYKREHFAAKYSNRDNKNEEVLSGKALEDKKMIYNLNQMGKKDEHLSKLMKVLASGNGSKDEIAEFKTYMETARNMKAPPNWNGNEKEVAKQKKKVDSEQLKKNKKEDEEKLNEELTKIQDLRKTLQDKKDALQKEKDLYLTEQENIERESINAQRKKDNDNLKEPVVDIIKKPNENQKKVTKEVEMKTEPEKSTSGNISLHNEKMRAEETEQKSETQAYEENLEDKQIKAEGEEEEDINDISQYEASLEKSGKKKKLAYEDQLTNFQNKYTSKCDLVFEFLDNSNDRYLIPKDSILEYNSESNIARMSWITIVNYKEINQRITKKKNNKFDYTENMRQLFPVDFLEKSGIQPIFITNTVEYEMHWKYLPILKANLMDQEEVFATMEWIIQNGKRVDQHNLVYMLQENNKQEFDLAESLREEVYKYELVRSRFKK
ncbi:hypothetical protein QEN19_002160 [Hanseniaspora menglaensis]